MSLFVRNGHCLARSGKGRLKDRAAKAAQASRRGRLARLRAAAALIRMRRDSETRGCDMAAEGDAEARSRPTGTSYRPVHRLMKWGAIVSFVIALHRHLHHRDLRGPGGEDRGPQGDGGRASAASPPLPRRSRNSSRSAPASRSRPAPASPPRSPTPIMRRPARRSARARRCWRAPTPCSRCRGPDPAALDGVEAGRAGRRHRSIRSASASGSTPMPRPGSRRWRWSSCRASPAPSRWTCCPASRTSPATRRCSTPPPNMAAPSR